MLVVAGKAATVESAKRELARRIASGEALRVMERMVSAQGGDPRVVRNPSVLEVAPGVPVLAAESGFIDRVDAREIGLAAVALGAGRTRADQRVDPAVGISVEAKPGARVARGEPLALLHVRRPGDADAVRGRVERAFGMAPEAPPPRPLLLGRVGA